MADDIDIWDVFSMDADGSHVVKLTQSESESLDPAYSPDGTLIAFGWDAPGKEGIYVMRAVDGGGIRRITSVPPEATHDYGARFAPNGAQLLFTREVSDHESAIFVVNLDGTGLKRVTPPSANPNEADWSHEGSRIAFYAESTPFPYESIWIVGSDGTGLRNLNTISSTPGVQDGYSDPVWSPDDSLILIDHALHFEDGTATGGLATIRPDGSDLRYVADGKGLEARMDWNKASC